MLFPRKHWSSSSLSQYLRCPLQYYFERVLRLPKPTVASGLVLGGAVHEALAYYHRGLQRGHSATISRVQEVFAKAWYQKESTQKVTYKSGQNRVSQQAIGVALLETYLNSPPPENIQYIEHEITVPLVNSQGEYLETPLVAILDLVTTTDTGLKIHELKTSARAYSQFEVDTSLQATCYQHAANTQFDLPVEVEFAVLTKTKSPRLQRISTELTKDSSTRLGDLVQTIERAVDQQIFYPIESPLNCSGCPFREPCQDWQSCYSSRTPETHQLNGTASC